MNILYEPSIGFCVSWGWEIGKGFSSFLMGSWEICIGIDTMGRGSNIDPILPMFIPMFNPGMSLLFSILGGEFPRLVFGKPLECCCDIVTLCEFCILVNDVVLIMLSNWLCIDMCAASPCGRFIFKFAILILPKFRLEAILAGIIFTDFTSDSKFKLVLLLVLLVVWDVWMNDDSFLSASVWSKEGCCAWIKEGSFLIACDGSKGCVVGTEAI